jgi:outer membrane receptor protein involved in Fe transport
MRAARDMGGKSMTPTKPAGYLNRAMKKQRMTRASSLALALIGFAAYAPAAQAQTGQAPLAETDTADANDIIVTARRREESLQDVPVAVAALSPQQLEAAVVTDISSISQLVPSMVVGRAITGSSASIFLRGVGSTSLSSGFDQSVSINLDGIAMSRGKEIINAQYDLAGIEVLKGPQALFFGKNSTGGVVTVRSADPTADFEARVKLGYEIESQEMYGEGFVSGPITDSLRFRVAARGSTQQGFFPNTGQTNTTNGLTRVVSARTRGAAESFSVRGTLLYDGADDLRITLKGQLSQINDDGAGAFYERKCAAGRTVPRATSGIPAIYSDCAVDGRNDTADLPPQIAAVMPYARDGKTYTDHDSHYGVLTIDKGFGPITLTSVTAHYGFKQSDNNSFNGAAAGIYVSQYNEFRQFSQEFRAISDFDGPFNFTGGLYYADAFYRFDTAAFAAVLAPDPSTGNYHSFGRIAGFDGKSYSAFTELRWNILENLELAGGVRWSREEKDSFSDQYYRHQAFASQFGIRQIFDTFRDENLSPQATLTWKPTSDITIYGAYKQGFKAGGYNTSLTVTPTVTNAAGRFKSETAEGGEIGLRTELLDRQLRFNVTAYDYTYNDLQVQIFDAATITQTVSNAGALNTRGVEVELNLRPRALEGFEAHASIAYNRAIFKDYVGTCFTGQTIAEGCTLDAGPTGAFNNQDFDGRRAPKAPLWAGRVGASYATPVSGDIQFGISTDASFSSNYNFTDSLRPDAVQPSYVRWDAGVRLFDEESGWEFALIGRNLANKFVITSANDMPAQGTGGTGTAVGIRSDLNTIVDRPRQIYLQFTKRF